MQFKEKDIIKIKNLNVEGMIMYSGKSFETDETMYCIVTQQNLIYFVKDCDIIKIGTLEEKVEEYRLENSSHAIA